MFRAEIFISWCIVQKHCSGIVTCYTVITIDYDLTNVSGILLIAMENEAIAESRVALTARRADRGHWEKE